MVSQLMNNRKVAVELIGKTKDFESKFKKADSTVAKFGATAGLYTGTVVAATAATVAWADSTAKAGDEIDKNSQRLQVSRREYQELKYIYDQNGTSIESLIGAMGSLQSQQAAASRGNKENIEILQDLGLEYEGRVLNINEVITALREEEDQEKRNAYGTKLLGGEYAKLQPIINSSEESIEGLREKFHDLNLEMSDEAVDASVKWTDTRATISAQLGILKDDIGVVIIEGMQPALEITSAVINKYNELPEPLKRGILAAGGIGTAVGVIAALSTLFGAVTGNTGALNANTGALTGKGVAGTVAGGVGAGAARGLPVSLVGAGVAGGVVAIALTAWTISEIGTRVGKSIREESPKPRQGQGNLPGFGEATDADIANLEALLAQAEPGSAAHNVLSRQLAEARGVRVLTPAQQRRLAALPGLIANTKNPRLRAALQRELESLQGVQDVTGGPIGDTTNPLEDLAGPDAFVDTSAAYAASFHAFSDELGTSSWSATQDANARLDEFFATQAAARAARQTAEGSRLQFNRNQILDTVDAVLESDSWEDVVAAPIVEEIEMLEELMGKDNADAKALQQDANSLIAEIRDNEFLSAKQREDLIGSIEKLGEKLGADIFKAAEVQAISAASGGKGVNWAGAGFPSVASALEKAGLDPGSFGMSAGQSIAAGIFGDAYSESETDAERATVDLNWLHAQAKWARQGHPDFAHLDPDKLDAQLEKKLAEQVGRGSVIRQDQFGFNIVGYQAGVGSLEPEGSRRGTGGLSGSPVVTVEVKIGDEDVDAVVRKSVARIDRGG